VSQQNWIPRPYKEGDEEGIFELRKAVFPDWEDDHDAWMRRWHWLYRENPASYSVIMVAEHGGRIVGHSAIIPIRAKVGGTIEHIRLSSDAMTHPEYRRQGILTTLSKSSLLNLNEVVRI
jgi:GNAT superfamily N-acetyltransferase